MKKLLLLSLLFVVNRLFAQDGPYRHLKLESDQVVFQEAYPLDSATSEQVKAALAAYVPAVKGLKDYRLEGEVITAVLSGAYVNYKKYGGKWGSTVTFLNHPFSANVNVIWKDGRYRATVTNIVFHTEGLGDMDATMLFAKGKKQKTWETKPLLLKAGTYLEQYLHDLFTIKPSSNW